MTSAQVPSGEIYAIRKWCPVVRLNEELNILGWISQHPHGEGLTPLGDPEDLGMYQFSGAVQNFDTELGYFETQDKVIFELIGGPVWDEDLQDESDEFYTIRKPIFDEFARTWERPKMPDCFDGLIDMIVADTEQRKNAQKEILGEEAPPQEPPTRPPRLSAATTTYATDQPTEENLTQRQNRSGAPSGHISSWLRDQTKRPQENNPSIPEQSTFVIKPPKDFENTPRIGRTEAKSKESGSGNRSMTTRSQSRGCKEKSSGEKSSTESTASKNSKTDKANGKVDAEVLKNIPVQRHIHLIQPLMPTWEKEAEELYTWGVELIEDKTVKVISIKGGKKWRSGEVIEVLHHALPYVFVRTKRRIYKLTGSIDKELSRPKEFQGYIALAFLDGFPHYWTTVRDIIVERAKGTQDRLELERNKATEMQNAFKPKEGFRSGSKNGSKVGSKNANGGTKETEGLNFVLTVPKLDRQATQGSRGAPSVMSTASGKSVPAAPAAGAMPPPSQKNAPLMPPPVIKPPIEKPAREERRLRPKKHQDMLERVKNMPSLSGNSSPSFDQSTAMPGAMTTPVPPARQEKNVRMASGLLERSGLSRKQIFSSTPHCQRNRKDTNRQQPIPSTTPGAEFEMNFSMIEKPHIPVAPPPDFLSPRAREHIRKPTESSEDDDLRAAKSTTPAAADDERVTPTFGFGVVKSKNTSGLLLKPVECIRPKATSPSEKRGHGRDTSSEPDTQISHKNGVVVPSNGIEQAPKKKSAAAQFEKPSRPQRKRTKQKSSQRYQHVAQSDSDSDTEPPATFQYSKKSAKSKSSKSKQVEKLASKSLARSSKKSHRDAGEALEAAPEITANKNSKKYRKQRQAHLIHNQRSAQVDVTIGEIQRKPELEPRTPPRNQQARRPPSAIGMDDLDDLDNSLGLDIGDIDRPLPSQEAGRHTPSWFRTPNASDVESQITTMINTRQSLGTEAENDQENHAQNIMVNNVLTNKLSKKVLKKKTSDKGKTAQRRAKQKLDKRVLTPSNQQGVMKKLNKLVAGQKKKKQLDEFSTSAEDSDFNSQETTNDALHA